MLPHSYTAMGLGVEVPLRRIPDYGFDDSNVETPEATAILQILAYNDALLFQLESWSY
jgi:hypothetical protein